MGTMIMFLSLLFESPLPSPSPSPISLGGAVSTAGDLITTGIVTKTLISLFAGLVANPIVGGPVLIVFMGLLYAGWSYIKAQYRAWQIKQAQDATGQAEQDFVQDQIVTNPANTDKDNEGRDQLDNLP